jgi:hypothetical protein
MRPLKNKDCDLCLAEKITERYHEGDTFWVADCKTCGVPMAVYKWHMVRLSVSDFDLLCDILKIYFPEHPREKYDFKRRSIPDHFHMHLRK